MQTSALDSARALSCSLPDLHSVKASSGDKVEATTVSSPKRESSFHSSMTVPADEVKPTPVNHDGGIVAFATTPSPGATVPQEMEKASRPDNDVSHETTFTQELVAVAEALENLPDDMSSLPSHMIQLIHHGRTCCH